MAKMTILVGLPRSGKSTFSQKWIREQGENPRTIISQDAIRMALGHRYNEHLEEVIKVIYYNSIKAALHLGIDVLCDDTHTRLSSIERLLKYDPEAEVIFIPKRFDVHSQEFDDHVQECKKRALATYQDDLCGPIGRMAYNLREMLGETFLYNKFDIDLEQARIRAAAWRPKVV